MIDRIANKINRVQDERAIKLEEALDYLDETTKESLRAEYKETIYYKGFAYTFDEEGFIEKNPITEGTLLEHSNNSIIKEIKKDDENITTEEVVITEENE
jgi:hypothetical protein